MEGVGLPLTKDEGEEVVTAVGGRVGLQIHFDLSQKRTFRRR